jgi:hypothetical protein
MSELQTGVIHHALEFVPACNNNAGITGQATYSSSFSCANSSGPGIPYGAYLWSDMTPTQLNTISGLDNATKMICVALNQYGAVASDINGSYNSISVNTLWNETGTQGAAYTQWVNANMTNGQTSPNKCFPGGWQNHLHILAF